MAGRTSGLPQETLPPVIHSSLLHNMENEAPYGRCLLGHPLEEDGSCYACEKLEFNAQ